jgi:hypothetical protein
MSHFVRRKIAFFQGKAARRYRDSRICQTGAVDSEAVEKLPRLSVLSTRKGIPNSEITEKSGAKPVLKSLDAMINSVSFRVYQQLLTLAESKTLLRTLQEVMVKHQVQEFVETHHQCP